MFATRRCIGSFPYPQGLIHVRTDSSSLRAVDGVDMLCWAQIQRKPPSRAGPYLTKMLRVFRHASRKQKSAPLPSDSPSAVFGHAWPSENFTPGRVASGRADSQSWREAYAQIQKQKGAPCCMSSCQKDTAVGRVSQLGAPPTAQRIAGYMPTSGRVGHACIYADDDPGKICCSNAIPICL